MQASVPDGDEEVPEEELREHAPEGDASSAGREGDVPTRCLCPPSDWRSNRERALANNCPAWIIACFMAR